ncbi:MAG: hypothetical protein P1V20_24145 [Verrucomicrobiales bacterium]|nr:hypothetical protein [Verrucomicrobiales bacterium]
MIDDLNLYGDLNSPETVIHCDPVSGLPLLSEKESIHKLILNYLPLPYSVAEFGCGQKAGIIIRMLCLVHGIPAHALQRLLIMERYMSPGTIEQTEYEKRPHALLSNNPLASRINSNDPAFHRFVENQSPEIELRNNVLRTGQYHLRLQPLVQFKKARSHVAVLITFWDEDRSCAVERIADATLDRNGLFPVETLRTLLRAAEAWIFTAPLMGEFRLRAAHFTESQREQISIVNGAGFSPGEIPASAHASLFRSLSGASEGTIGDPSTWTWVNNIFVGDDKKMHAKLQEQSGKGNPARSLVKSLVKARTAGELNRANEIRENLDDLARQLNLRKVLQKEALRCEKELAPLAEAANTVSHFTSLRHIADLYRKGSDLFSTETDRISRFHGTGVSLRRRIETAATCSRNSEGRIDARALNDHYFTAASETIRQMNHDGLDVFVDKVGNLHGLRLDREVSEDIATGALSISDVTRDSLCIASHIDTVFDAGKYDGRLGVFSGIEVVETLQNLERCFGVRVASGNALCPIMVSVYVGEEMTFSGENVSLPGSAAVAGLAEPEAIFRMTNAAGETWLDRLEAMWEFLREQIREKRITLHQSQKLLLESDDRRNLPGPTQFRPRHYFERHVEQGTFLQRCESPLVITERVAGVRHEDFTFEGSRAEAAAWEMIRRLRLLIEQESFSEIRSTTGIFAASKQTREPVSWSAGWTLSGTSDHAGTTDLADRRDSAVAAARLAHRFLEITKNYRPLIGGGVVLSTREAKVLILLHFRHRSYCHWPIKFGFRPIPVLPIRRRRNCSWRQSKINWRTLQNNSKCKFVYRFIRTPPR